MLVAGAVAILATLFGLHWTSRYKVEQDKLQASDSHDGDFTDTFSTVSRVRSNSPNARKTSFILVGMSGNNAWRPGGILSALAELDCGTFGSSAEQVKIFGMGSMAENELWGHVEALFKGGSFSDVKSMQSTCTFEKFKSQTQYVVTRKMAEVTSEVNNFDGGEGTRIYYLSIPPKYFAEKAVNVKSLTPKNIDLRIILEKPFGTDQSSAKTLQKTMQDAGLEEDEIYRIDHYLGKHMLQVLQPFRRFNMVQVDDILNGRNFPTVRIIQHEKRDSDGRSDFLDQTGQVRDMIQSHLLQALALAAMDLPAKPSDVDKAKLEVFKNIRVVDGTFGQYEGFLQEPGVRWSMNRSAATYANMKFQVQTSRWKGEKGYTDFYIETGKALDSKYAEIRYETESGCALVVRIQGLRPDEDVGRSQQRIYIDTSADQCPLFFRSLLGGEVPLRKPAQLELDSMDPDDHNQLPKPFVGTKETLILDYSGYVLSAYAILLKAAFDGNRYQYLNMDQIDLQWAIVDEYLEQDPKQLRIYPNGCGKEGKVCPDFKALKQTAKDWMCVHKEMGVSISFSKSNDWNEFCSQVSEEVVPAPQGEEEVVPALQDEEGAVQAPKEVVAVVPTPQTEGDNVAEGDARPEETNKSKVTNVTLTVTTKPRPKSEAQATPLHAIVAIAIVLASCLALSM